MSETTTIIHTEAELHALLDSLVNGQVVTAIWHFDKDHTVTATGPALVDGAHVSCTCLIRSKYDHKIDSNLISVEVTTEQATTVTRDDESAMHALLDGLTDGDKLTVEYRDDDRVSICIGSADVGHDEVDVHHAVGVDMVRWDDRDLSHGLHSITATRPTTVRWGRGE